MSAPAIACTACNDPAAPLHCRGLCRRCYARTVTLPRMRARAGMVPGPGKKWRRPGCTFACEKPCKVRGCPRDGGGGFGYCARHYKQWRRYGRAEARCTPVATPWADTARGVADPAKAAAALRAEQVAQADRELAQLLDPYAHCVMPIERRVAFRRRIAQLRAQLAALRHAQAAEAAPCNPTIERRA